MIQSGITNSLEGLIESLSNSDIEIYFKASIMQYAYDLENRTSLRNIKKISDVLVNYKIDNFCFDKEFDLYDRIGKIMATDDLRMKIRKVIYHNFDISQFQKLIIMLFYLENHFYEELFFLILLSLYKTALPEELHCSLNERNEILRSLNDDIIKNEISKMRLCLGLY